MSTKARNDLSKYGVSIAAKRTTSDTRVVPASGGGWVVRNASTGQYVGVGSAQPAPSPGKLSTRADVIKAADTVIARHNEVIKKLAKR